MKKVVHYKKNSVFGAIVVGHSAYVEPVDHTSSLVSNTKHVRTSEVIRVDHETGEFETLNSIYRPQTS